MLVDFKSICYPVCSLVSNETLFKDEWCVFFHVLNPSIFLSLLIHDNIQLFDWLLIVPIKFNMHFNNFSCLLGNNIIQLSREIFRWETEVLGKYYVPENVLTI